MTARMLLQLSRAANPGEPFAFDFRPQPYLVRWGDAEERRARLEWTETLQQDLAALASLAADGEVQAGVSQTLRRFLVESGWWDAHRGALEACRTRTDRMELVIRSRAAELYTLPWELVQLDDGTPLGAIPRLLLRYEWPVERSIVPPPEPLPRTQGRTIFAWSAAGGAVPSAEHDRALRAALDDGPAELRAGYIRLDQVGPTGLQAALEDAARAGEPVAVLHLLAHGTTVVRERNGEEVRHFALALSDEDGERLALDGPGLMALLEPYRDLVRTVVLCACQAGGRGGAESRVGSIAQELHRGGIQAVLASRLPLSTAGSVVLARDLYPSLLAASMSLEEAMLRVRTHLRRDSRLAEVGGRLDWASLQLLAHPSEAPDLRPYIIAPWCPGGPVDASRRAFLVGRGAVLVPGTEVERPDDKTSIGRLLARVLGARSGPRAERLQVLLGELGSGKSSLVTAGIAPWLERGTLPAWRVLLAEPDHPGDSRGPFAQWLDAADPLARHRHEAGEAGAREALRARLADAPGPSLLVLDQAEELLTHCTAEERLGTLQGLWELAQDEAVDVVVLLLLRTVARGAIARIALAGEQEPRILSRLVHGAEHCMELAPLPPSGLQVVVKRPARRAGLAVEGSLAQLAVSELVEVETGLPLLVYTLGQLWRLRTPDERLGLAAYHDLGGTAGALASRAEEIVTADGIATTGEPSLRLVAARALFLALGGGRPDSAGNHRVFLHELLGPGPGGEVDAKALGALVEDLLRAGLLFDGRAPDSLGRQRIWLMVAQPALLSTWERLRTWQQEDAHASAIVREVESAAQAWDQRDRDPEALARPPNLGFYEQVLAHHRARLTEVAREFVGASAIWTRKRERRIHRTRLALATLLGLVAIGAVGTSIWVHLLGVRASDAGHIAAAELVRERDPTLGLQLLAEVEQPQRHPRWAALATETLLRPHSAAIYGPLRGGVSQLAFGPRSERLFAGDQGGSVWVFDRDHATPVLELHRGAQPGSGASPLVDLAVSPAGDQVAASWADGLICAEALRQSGDAGARAELQRCAWHPAMGSGTRVQVAFSEDGSRLSSAGAGLLVSWTLGDELVPREQIALPGGRELVELFPDGRGVWLDGTEVRVADPACTTACVGMELGAPLSERSLVALSPDRLHIAVHRPGEDVLRGDLDGGASETGVSQPQTVSLALSPDAMTVLVGSDDTHAYLRDLLDPRRVRVLRGHRGGVGVVAFSPDGGVLATGSGDRMVRVWRTPRETLDLALPYSGAEGGSWAVAAWRKGFVTPASGRSGLRAGSGEVLQWWPDSGEERTPLVEELPGGPGVVQGLAVLELDGSASPVAFVGTDAGEVIASRRPAAGREARSSTTQRSLEPVPAPWSAHEVDGFGSIWGIDACGAEGSEEVRVAIVGGEPGRGALAVLTWSAAEGWVEELRHSHDNALWDVSFGWQGCAEVLTADDDGRLQRWLVAPPYPPPGQPELVWQHEEGLAAFGLAVGQGCLVAGFIDGTLELAPHPGPARAGACDAELTSHAGAVWNVDFDQQGRRVLSAALDGTLLVQGVHSSDDKAMVRLTSRRGGLRDGVFDQTGSEAIGVGELPTVQLWDLVQRDAELDDLAEEVRAATSACLTARDRELLLRLSPDEAEQAVEACVRRQAGSGRGWDD